MNRGYPDDWDQRRRAVYERDNYTCRNCGRTGGVGGSVELHCHHIVPKGRGGTHHPSNPVTLCEDCHRAVHNRHAIAPTAGPSDVGSGGVASLYRRSRPSASGLDPGVVHSLWRAYKRLRRLF